MENVTNPYLFRFLKKCISPGRSNIDSEYEYNSETDMLHWVSNTNKPAAIDEAGMGGPTTKKCDIEKGEDNKDRRMWE
jgi:hypothetical protein